MKRLLVFVFALIITTGLSQSYNFCEGWERGFEKGYCRATEGSANAIGCVAPPAPPCGIPDIGEDNFSGGYDAGYEEGMNVGRNEGSSGSYRSRVDPSLIDNSAESLNKAAVNVANSLDKLFSDPDYIAYRKKKKEEKKNRKRNKPKSSNWISFSSGFVADNRDWTRGLTEYSFDHVTKIRTLITELNFSHSHFLNSKKSLLYDGGIFFDYTKYDRDYISFSGIPVNISITSLSLSGRILYNHHFNKFSINTGFGMSLITLQRRKTSYYTVPNQLIFYLPGLFIGKKNEYFGIVGLNFKINENNEVGIKTYYKLLYQRRKPMLRTETSYYYGALRQEIDWLPTRLIFQLKFNHRLK